MSRNTIRRTALTLAATTALVLTAACGDDGGGGGGDGGDDFLTDLQMGTGSTGGTYYPLGGEMATVMARHADVDGLNVTALETGASLENLTKIGNGELQLGMTINGTAVDALEGNAPFDDNAIENFGYITQIYPEVLHIVTLEGSGVESVEDLAEKRVAIGPPGGASNVLAQQVLAAHGIEQGDYQAFAEDFSIATDRMQNGQIDANFGILGSPAASVDQIQATTGEVKYLDISDDAMQTLLDETFYEEYTLPADTYSWLEDDVTTLTARAILVASTTQVSEDVGYELTKALLENGSEITHDQGRFMTAEEALEGRLDLPLHPGAQRYYDEIGMGE